MSSSIRFKFKSNLKFDSILFDGSSIKVKDLKNAIRQKSHLTSNDYDIKLEDTNGKVYTNENEFVPKYTSVIASRIPKVSSESQRKKILNPEDLSKRDAYKNRTEDPKFHHLLSSTNLLKSGLSEEEKIKLMIEQSTEQYAEKHFPVKPKPYGHPPSTYVCNKCRKGGHWIHECPGVRDKDGRLVDPKTIKRPTGIPQAHLIEVEAGTPGAYLDHSGKYMVPINDAEAYAAGKKEKRPFSVEENPPYIPPTEEKPPADLLCPLCHELYKDAVSTRCCKKAYCVNCIMNYAFDVSSGGGHHKCPNCGDPIRNNETDLLPCVYMRDLVKQWRSSPESLRVLFQLDTGAAANAKIQQSTELSTSSSAAAISNSTVVSAKEEVVDKEETPAVDNADQEVKEEPDNVDVSPKATETPTAAIRRVLKPKPIPETTKNVLISTHSEAIIKRESSSPPQFTEADEKEMTDSSQKSPVPPISTVLPVSAPVHPPSPVNLSTEEKKVVVVKEERKPEEGGGHIPIVKVIPQIVSAAPTPVVSTMHELTSTTTSEIMMMKQQPSIASITPTVPLTTPSSFVPQQTQQQQHFGFLSGPPSHTTHSAPFLSSSITPHSTGIFSHGFITGVNGTPLNVVASAAPAGFDTLGNMYSGGGGGCANLSGVEQNYQNLMNQLWTMNMPFPQSAPTAAPAPPVQHSYPIQPVNNNDAAIAAFLAACRSGGATGIATSSTINNDTTLTREEFYAYQKFLKRSGKRHRREKASRSPSPRNENYHRKYSRSRPYSSKLQHDRKYDRDDHVYSSRQSRRQYKEYSRSRSPSISRSRSRSRSWYSPSEERQSKESGRHARRHQHHHHRKTTSSSQQYYVEKERGIIRRSRENHAEREIAIHKQPRTTVKVVKEAVDSSHRNSPVDRPPSSCDVVNGESKVSTLEDELGPEPIFDIFGDIGDTKFPVKSDSDDEERRQLKRQHKESKSRKKSKHKKKHKKHKKRRNDDPSDSVDNSSSQLGSPQ